jgi:hypothetical protein
MLTFNWYTVSREDIELGDIRCVELYCFNIGGELCSEWEKYTSVKLYLVLSYTVLMKTDYQALCCMTLCSNIVVMFILYVCVELMMNSAMLY